ncbi:ABC transporter permease [Mechercharimyces sp. CAU 1602]|uniref:ABC transporter permease n=1 Tax=Mechercharimyces sp. CAU 1602 TaxID=2973933 RepID=UPI002163982E|nr:ABC transporter permease [Mechercharimyces sp. CAU 1602]MCS1351817.1 ABC transporter permease [Mechercharimyces sp. CAU 1602]
MKWWNRFLRNPVIEKEFRQRMRRRRTPWLVALYLLITGVISFAFAYLSTPDGQFLRPDESQMLFLVLAVVQLVMMAFVIPGLTAGLISGERERQTLPVLLTTPLSSTSIVMSKLISSLSFMVILLIATVPLYAIMFLFGGTSVFQLIRVIAHLIVSIFFMGCLGIFFSSLIKRSAIATVVTYISVAVIGVGGFIAHRFVTMWMDRSRMNEGKIQEHSLILEWLEGLNPIMSLIETYFNTSMFYVFQGEDQLSGFFIFTSTYSLLGVVLLLFSIYFLSPLRWQRWGNSGG